MPRFPTRNSPGEYRQRFTITKPTSTTPGAHGEPQNAQSTVIATIWGKLTPWGGALVNAAGQIMPQSIDYLEMRYRPGLSKGMIVTQTNCTPQRTFHIQSIDDQEGRKEKLVIKLVEFA